MSSYINTNILSVIAQRNLNVSQGALNASLQYLSSGMRVTASAFQALLLVSLLVMASQGIPFLASHFDGIIGTIQLGYWLFSVGAVLLCTMMVLLLISKD